jgi:hypothetical protein
VTLQTYDKRSIALRQIETALWLLDNGQDLFSVITLAGAAEEICGQLLKEAGIDPSLSSLTQAATRIHEAIFSGTPDVKTFVTRANRARNVLKHHTPGEDREVTLDLRREAIDLLDRAVSNHWLLEQELTPAMKRFVADQAE